jgi:hypothetical protein
MNHILLFTVFILELLTSVSCGVKPEDAEKLPEETIIYSLSVESRWPASNWNFYIRRNTIDSRPERCDGTETATYPSPCLHSGEVKLVKIEGPTSCDHFKLDDSLLAFNWNCETTDGGIQFISSLSEKTKIGDLIDGPSLQWKKISVTLKYKEIIIGHAPESIWWTNSIVALPENASSGVIILDGVDDDGDGPDQAYNEGTVFFLGSSRESRGYQIGLNSIALAFADDASLTLTPLNPIVNNCNSTAGTTISPNASCLIFSSGKSFLWLEGKLKSTSSHAVVFSGVKFSIIHGLSSSPGGMILTGLSDSNRFLNSSFLGTISLIQANYNLFERVWIHSSGDGIFVQANDGSIKQQENVFSKIRIHSGAQALHLRRTYSGFVFSDIIMTGGGLRRHSNPGFGGDMILINATGANIAGSYNSGIHFNNTSGFLAAHNLAFINLQIGLNHAQNASKDTSFSDLAFSNYSTAIRFGYATDLSSRYSGTLLFGIPSVTECEFSSAPTNSGLTISGSIPGIGNCLMSGTSLGEIERSITDFSDAFFGKQIDTLNASDDNQGQAIFSSNLDFKNFDNDYRLWGLNGDDFPTSNQRGSCLSADSTCQIWDFRIKPGNLNLRKNGSVPGGFIKNEKCPADAHGSQALRGLTYPLNSMTYRIFANAIEDMNHDDDGICEKGERCYQRYLRNAVEIINDNLGDDDGLCENNESCLYSPYFGAYQGSGEKVSCQFEGSSEGVTGVTLYGYE